MVQKVKKKQLIFRLNRSKNPLNARKKNWDIILHVLMARSGFVFRQLYDLQLLYAML
jgi:hypothetical protein